MSNDVNKLHWYVVSNNTSWCNTNDVVIYGPFGSKDEAIEYCLKPGERAVLLSKMEAASMSC